MKNDRIGSDDAITWAHILLIFSVGALVGHTITALTYETTLLAILTLLASFDIVKLLAGSGVANEYHFLSYAVAAAMDGLLLVLIYIGARIVTRRLSSGRVSTAWVVAIAVVLQAGLLLIPGGKE